MLVTAGVKGLVAIQHPWTSNALGKLFKLYNKMSKYKIEPSPNTITRETPFNLDPNQHKIKDKTFFFQKEKENKARDSYHTNSSHHCLMS